MNWLFLVLSVVLVAALAEEAQRPGSVLAAPGARRMGNRKAPRAVVKPEPLLSRRRPNALRRWKSWCCLGKSGASSSRVLPLRRIGPREWRPRQSCGAALCGVKGKRGLYLRHKSKPVET